MVTTCLLPLRHRFFALLCVIAAVIALAFPTLAETQDNKGLEPLAQAMKAFQAGDYQQATQLIEEAQKAGLDRSLSARALLLRAQVNEKSGNTARALSDYSSALWLSALSTEDSKVASAGRDRILAEMGVGGAKGKVQASANLQQTPIVDPNEKSQSGSGVSGFFSGLFGGGERKPASPAPSPQPAKESAAVVSVQKEAMTAKLSDNEPVPQASSVLIRQGPASKNPVESAWRPVHEAHAEPNRLGGAAHVHAPADNAVLQASSPLAAGFRIELGAARSQEVARSQAKQLKAQLAAILVHRELDITASANGYRISAGPYKTKGSADALCAAIKRHGVSCAVTQ